MASLLPMQVRFPTFVQARSRLMLEEINLDARARTAGTTALIATNGGSSSGWGSSGGDRGQQLQQAGGYQPRQAKRSAPSERGGRGRGRGNGGHGGLPPASPSSQQPWMGYFAPWGAPFPPPGRAPWVPPNAARVLGPRPGVTHHAYPMVYGAPPAYGAAPHYGAPPPPPQHAAPPPPSCDQTGLLHTAMNNMSLQPPATGERYLDTGASNHITNNAGNLSSYCFSSKHPSILVGDGSYMPVLATGTASLPPRPFSLNHVLFSPSIIKNLLSVRQFTTDNSVSVEFDPHGFLGDQDPSHEVK